ncbi:MAG TPA: glycoside hydrolase family 2 TIM barrel-domain containing protein [Candidatus Udaeobacter sp.]|nr:glycoside hydrolase family 2 TIM barrel-domain containing protein [Candidatus Udaeobacter sp.]
MRTRTFLPRPEYPRPDRQRSFVQAVDWLNLNGAWEFRFDGDDHGRERRWYEPDEQCWPDQIIVPFCWESLAAWGEADAAGNNHYYATRVYRNPLEVTAQNYRSAARFEVGWYRRKIRIPANEKWRGKRVILTIGAADFYTEAWCNGHRLGTHEGGFSPFEFELTGSLSSEAGGELTGTIVIRVEDRMENYEQPVGKQWGWYSSASGIWQTVFVEPRAPEFIERFEITSNIESATVKFRIFCAGGSKVDVQTTSPAGKDFCATTAVRAGFAEAELNVGRPMLWDTSCPQLYSVRFRLHGNGGDDVVHSYFGMRSLSAKSVEGSSAPGTLYLNGEPIYLRGALYQSYFPDGIYTAGDTQTLRDDISYARRAGFDLLRVHIKVDDPMLLYYADTLGILLMCDFPNFGEGGDTERGRSRYEATMRAAIARDFNHPSIVAWCLFNETWGFGGQAEFMKLINPIPPVAGKPFEARGRKLSNENAYKWIQAMWHLAKSLDPTRLIEDMSVVAWEHLEYYGHGETDINSWHFYTSDYSTARRWIGEVVEQTYAGSTFNYVPGFRQDRQPLIASEYGGIAALDGDLDTSWSFKFLTNELRRHSQLSAYIYTELHDVEWERNGFLNYDRTPKDFGYDPRMVNAGDVLPIDSPPIRRCTPGEEVRVNVFSSHFSRLPRHDVMLQWRLGGIDSLGWVYDTLVADRQPIPFPHLRVELAKQVKLQMPQQTMLCTLEVRAVVPDGTVVASNYVQFFVDGGYPESERIDSRVVIRLDAHGWRKTEWTRYRSSRAEAASAGFACGAPRGFFDYAFPADVQMLRSSSRVTVLCEASSLRGSAAQTDRFVHPSRLRLLLNDVPIYRTILPNHPHDARGALTYLNGGRGAYGYLCHATVEGELLREVVKNMDSDHLRLRCLVPRDEQPQGGLTIYGQNTGRYPLGPTIIIE